MNPGLIAGVFAIAIGSLPIYAAGSQACASCHPEIYRRYQTTPMANTSGIAGSASTGESWKQADFSTPGGVARFTVSKISGGLEFAFSSGEMRGRRSLDYFIGSGTVGRSYLTDIDGYLFQAPVSYYSKPAAWGLSPGYERGEPINLSREAEPACLNCHATGLRPLAGTVNGYARPPFRETGVGCERCHGPGEEHVAKMRGGNHAAGSGAAIVNPAKLPAPRRSSVCAQCHLLGAVEMSRATGRRPYQPGDLLSDSVSVFVWAGSTRETTVNGHFEQLARSACQRASGEKIWCGTCHDPHSAAPATPAYYRGKCLSCHSVSSCQAPAQLRGNAADQCTSCHMPAASAITVQHAAFTDHSIPRFSRPVSPSSIPADSSLVPFDGFTGADRELGLAYATVALRDANRVWGTRAFDLLRRANRDAPDDSAVATLLAALYDRAGNQERACQLYARIVASGDTTSAAAVNHGTCLAKAGKLEEAMRIWRVVTQRNPGLEGARLNLAVAQIQSGLTQEARANLTAALRFNPVSKRARELLTGLGQ